MIKKIIMMVLMVLSSTVVFAQKITVKAIIIDAKSKKPIENASIQLKNTDIFSVSDRDGQFSIIGSPNDIILISHISYKDMRLKIKAIANSIVLQPKSINLDDIVVKANVLNDISHSSVIIDHIKEATQPRNVGDLFRNIAGFGIEKRGAYASEPVFRAFKYEQLNVQYDGGMKVLNACPNRMDPITTHVIPDEIEKIEVVKGPFTVRFGSNFGGIINLVSKKPSITANRISGSIGTGYETNGGNLSTRANLMIRAHKFDFNINGEYRNYGDYKDGNGEELPASFRTTDYSLKAGFEPTNKQRVQLSWRQSFGRDIEHAGLPMDSPYDDSYLVGLDYKATDISEKLSAISIKGFYSYVDHLMTNENRPNLKVVDAKTNVFATTYGGKMELTFAPSQRVFVFTGLDANLIARDGSRIRKVKIVNGNPLPEPKVFIDKVWQDSKLNDFGIFAESNFRISDHYAMTTGLRVDFVNSSINDPEQDFLNLYEGTIADANETNVSGTISMRYKTKDLQIQLALGRGVKTASMIERYINHFNVSADPYEYVGNPNLIAEKNHQIELSFAKKFTRIELGASVFYSLIQDYIVPVVDQSIPRKFTPSAEPKFAKRFINIDKATQSGFEFYGKYSITDSFKFISDVSYTYAQNIELNEPLPQITPLTVNTALNFEREKYWIDLKSRFVTAQRRVSTSFLEQESAGFTTFDLSAGIKPFKNFTLGVSVLNIFDKAYHEHLNFSYRNSNLLSGRILEPGRNFTVRLNYKF